MGKDYANFSEIICVYDLQPQKEKLIRNNLNCYAIYMEKCDRVSFSMTGDISAGEFVI